VKRFTARRTDQPTREAHWSVAASMDALAIRVTDYVGRILSNGSLLWALIVSGLQSPPASPSTLRPSTVHATVGPMLFPRWRPLPFGQSGTGYVGKLGGHAAPVVADPGCLWVEKVLHHPSWTSAKMASHLVQHPA